MLSKKCQPFLYFALTGHSCTDVTVYSICNSGNPEIGIYNSIGDDSNGFSKYQSASNPTYQICYDIQSKASSIKIRRFLEELATLVKLGRYLVKNERIFFTEMVSRRRWRNTNLEFN